MQIVDYVRLIWNVSSRLYCFYYSPSFLLLFLPLFLSFLFLPIHPFILSAINTPFPNVLIPFTLFSLGKFFQGFILGAFLLFFTIFFPALLFSIFSFLFLTHTFTLFFINTLFPKDLSFFVFSIEHFFKTAFLMSFFYSLTYCKTTATHIISYSSVVFFLPSSSLTLNCPNSIFFLCFYSEKFQVCLFGVFLLFLNIFSCFFHARLCSFFFIPTHSFTFLQQHSLV
ncbi:unnamed protein product [Acanthosepion pharaonis]|uniref:Uncharacterized protein n=1 Tax=Acanthosepion pharaonis TaxID=158019 RepID=A0A812DUD6_ACAPH|nr:unnamed protein product [Sepia pharaonis]